MDGMYEWIDRWMDGWDGWIDAYPVCLYDYDLLFTSCYLSLHHITSHILPLIYTQQRLLIICNLSLCDVGLGCGGQRSGR